MRSHRIQVVALLAILSGCASSGPLKFGPADALAPRVAPQKGERRPLHLTLQVDRPANVAVFLVTPGAGSVLLFPDDSTRSGFVDAGSHLVQTSLAKLSLSDTSRLIRRPGQPQEPAGGMGRPMGGRGGERGGRESMSSSGFNQHGYLLVYASQDPLPYSILNTRVSGISIPIDDKDALTTVMKLIRETTHTTGPWAAYATSFPP